MTQKSSKIPNFDAVYTRLKIWYNPCIIRQYIYGKTDENHVLFSNYLDSPREMHSNKYGLLIILEIDLKNKTHGRVHVNTLMFPIRMFYGLYYQKRRVNWAIFRFLR